MKLYLKYKRMAALCDHGNRLNQNHKIDIGAKVFINKKKQKIHKSP